jgi:uncharacterized protein YdaL
MHPRESTPVEILLNGDTATKTRDGVQFAFFGQPGAEPRMSSVSPLAGNHTSTTIAT